MTQGKRKPLVPITREFLRQFYQKYPLEPVPVDVKDGHIQLVDELAGLVTKPGSKVPEQVGMPTPTRIDDCFWRNRMICEELALSLSKLMTVLSEPPELVAACGRCRDLLLSAERSIAAVQEMNTSSVKAQLKQFIPQDFRGALLERQRVSTEAKYHKQIEDLLKKGGTIRQKYDMYLQQQWERRQALVQLGECSGMYKMVIKWVAGIPQVLLDFAKEINAKLGPMEEQRIKYGPDLYGVTTLGLRLDVCLAGWAENAAAPTSSAAAAKMLDVVEPALHFYQEHMLRVIRFIGDVFQHSPFFVNKDDLDAQSGMQASCGGEGPTGMATATAMGHGGAPDDGDLASEQATSVASIGSATAVLASVGGAVDKRHYEAEADSKASSAPGQVLNLAVEGGAAVPQVLPVAAARAEAVVAMEETSKPPAPPLRIDHHTQASTTPGMPATPVPVPNLPACPSDRAGSTLAEVLQQIGKGPAPVPVPSGGKGALVVNLVAAAPAVADASAGTPPTAVPPPPPTATAAIASVAAAPASATAAAVAAAAASHHNVTAAPAVSSAAVAPAAAAPADPGAQQLAQLPPRVPPLVHVDTPSPHMMLAKVLASSANTATRSSGGGGGRASLTGDSIASFASAEDDQPWHQPEEGYVADCPGSSVSLLLGCLGLSHPSGHEHRSGGSSGSGAGAGHVHGRWGHGHNHNHSHNHGGGGDGADVGTSTRDHLMPISE